MTNQQPIDSTSLSRLGPVIRNELYQLARSGAVSAAVSLEHVFTQLFGTGRSREERLKFMLYAAPVARRIAIEMADKDERVGNSDVRVSDLREWLGWLDMFDPMCARMIDLHYFAGLSTRETALALDMRPKAVVKDLRFAKAWLQAKLL